MACQRSEPVSITSCGGKLAFPSRAADPLQQIIATHRLAEAGLSVFLFHSMDQGALLCVEAVEAVRFLVEQ